MNEATVSKEILRDVVVPIRSHTPYGLEENRLLLAIRPYGHYIFFECVTDD